MARLEGQVNLIALPDSWANTPGSSRGSVTVDCADPEAVATFWSDALDWSRRAYSRGARRLVALRGRTDTTPLAHHQ